MQSRINVRAEERHMDIEEARPHQHDLMMRRIERLLNEQRDIEATYDSGGINVMQGSDSIGWVFHRIKCDRSGLALAHYGEGSEV